MSAHHGIRWAVSCLLALATLSASRAESPATFRVHPINRESTYSAVAAFDVNKDGLTDVFCGGWWYEAPDWKRHFVRDVKQIRGRFDGYSHSLLDVNRDGWTDVVNCNYRSREIYWIEHPGAELGEWTKHVVETPGPMETGRLVDVDGDGRVDLLPNGVKFAAWWELTHDDGKATWQRHELPADVAGHGVGFGDVDGDGRDDIIGPTGFLQAPEDRRRGRWTWRPEFQIHRDCGLPILVHDVDGDGDSDLIWSRGHHFGIYWLEQHQVDGERNWRWHTIDSTFSQYHSLLLADIDNDGADELMAGKRYMGHDGKDLGEYDPLASFYYDFDGAARVWRRHPISYRRGVGFGLDPKAIDLDQDGDLDIVASGRSGLYWLENRLLNGSGYDHRKLLQIKTEAGMKEISTAAQWGLRRAAIVRGMEEAMGPLPSPERRVPLDVEVERSEDAGKYTRRHITFAAESGDRVPALLLVPHALSGRAPAMLCLHQTTRIGKGEPSGLGGLPNLHYAHELAERGYVCLAPDYPSFGDYEYNFKTTGGHYTSGSMKAIWNNLRAVDLLEAMPETHPDRIGVIGHSLGGHNSLFTAVFDQRLQVVVTSCGFTAFHHYYGGKLKGWTSDRYMPLINSRYGNNPDLAPFDFYEVVAAIAPRTVLINAPVRDGNFELAGVKKVVAEAGGVFRLLDAGDNLHAVYPDAGHDFPPDVRESLYKLIDQRLKP